MENKLQVQELLQKKELFIEYLDITKKTLNCYRNGVENFFEYLIQNNIQYPQRMDFKRYRDYLSETKKANTVNSYMTSVRMFFKYLESNNLYNDITKDVKSLKTSKNAKTQVLNQNKSKEIYNGLTDTKDKCLFSLAITTGLRASEIADAKIENLKMYNNELVLFVKCKKRDDASEYVKISNQVFEDIKNYIGNRTSGNIFVSTSNNNNNGGVSSKTIRLWVKKILKEFGIEEDGFSCHSLRRTCATISYLNGANIYDIQQVLHHNSIQTTVRYVNQIARDNNNIEKMLGNVLLGGE